MVGALTRVEPALSSYDASTLFAASLRYEFEALVVLYRAVGAADDAMQRLLRASEVGEQLLRVYDALRTTQASLSMRGAGRGLLGARRPS